MLQSANCKQDREVGTAYQWTGRYCHGDWEFVIGHTNKPSAKAKRDETACWKAITEQAELLQGLVAVDYGAKCYGFSSNQRGASPTFQGLEGKQRARGSTGRCFALGATVSRERESEEKYSYALFCCCTLLFSLFALHDNHNNKQQHPPPSRPSTPRLTSPLRSLIHLTSPRSESRKPPPQEIHVPHQKSH